MYLLFARQAFLISFKARSGQVFVIGSEVHNHLILFQINAVGDLPDGLFIYISYHEKANFQRDKERFWHSLLSKEKYEFKYYF